MSIQKTAETGSSAEPETINGDTPNPNAISHKENIMADTLSRKYSYNSFEDSRMYEAGEFIKGLKPNVSKYKYGQIIQFFQVPGSDDPLMALHRKCGDIIFAHEPEKLFNSKLSDSIVNGPKDFWPSHLEVWLHIPERFFSNDKQPQFAKGIELNGVLLTDSLPSSGHNSKKDLENYFTNSVTSLHKASFFNKDLLKISQAVISELDTSDKQTLRAVLTEKGCTSPENTLAVLEKIVEENHGQDHTREPVKRAHKQNSDVSISL